MQQVIDHWLVPVSYTCRIGGMRQSPFSGIAVCRSNVLDPPELCTCTLYTVNLVSYASGNSKGMRIKIFIGRPLIV